MIYFYIAVLIVIIFDFILYRKSKEKIKVLLTFERRFKQTLIKHQEYYDLLLKELGYKYIPAHEVAKHTPLSTEPIIGEIELINQFRNMEYETIPACLEKVKEVIDKNQIILTNEHPLLHAVDLLQEEHRKLAADYYSSKKTFVIKRKKRN